jgi:hypothetical protein
LKAVMLVTLALNATQRGGVELLKVAAKAASVSGVPELFEIVTQTCNAILEGSQEPLELLANATEIPPTAVVPVTL